MRHFSALLLLILPSLSACSDYCGKRKDYPIPFATFRLLDAATGTDLLFGAGARFNPRNIAAYYFSGEDSISIQPSSVFERSVNDSLVVLECSAFPPTVYLRLSAADTDTLNIRYQPEQYDSRCGSRSIVVALQYNGVEGERYSGLMYRLRKN